jgi:hypothetical protein
VESLGPNHPKTRTCLALYNSVQQALDEQAAASESYVVVDEPGHPGSERNTKYR